MAFSPVPTVWVVALPWPRDSPFQGAAFPREVLDSLTPFEVNGAEGQSCRKVGTCDLIQTMSFLLPELASGYLLSSCPGSLYLSFTDQLFI